MAYWVPAVTGAGVAKLNVTQEGAAGTLEAGTVWPASTVPPGSPAEVFRISTVNGVVGPWDSRCRSTWSIPPLRPAVKVWAGVSPESTVPVPTLKSVCCWSSVPADAELATPKVSAAATPKTLPILRFMPFPYPWTEPSNRPTLSVAQRRVKTPWPCVTGRSAVGRGQVSDAARFKTGTTPSKPPGCGSSRFGRKAAAYCFAWKAALFGEILRGRCRRRTWP